jgi:mono/diheme cytochrome c family protein
MLKRPARLSAALAFLVPVFAVGFGLTALAAASPQPAGQAGGTPAAQGQSSPATAGGGAGGAAGLPGDPSKGQTLYQQTCTSCHGATLEGGIGPPLNPIKSLGNTKNPLDPNYLETVITNGLSGVGGYGQMPPKGGNPKLTDQDVKDLAAYVIQQNKTAPGGHLSPQDLARSTVTWVTIGILGMLLVTWLLARYNMRWIARRAAARRAAEGRSRV